MADCLLSLTKVYKIEVRDVHILPGVCCWRSELIGSALWWRRPAGVAQWLYFTRIQTNFRFPPSEYNLMLSSVGNDLNKSLIENSVVGIYYAEIIWRGNLAGSTQLVLVGWIPHGWRYLQPGGVKIPSPIWKLQLA